MSHNIPDSDLWGKSFNWDDKAGFSFGRSSKVQTLFGLRVESARLAYAGKLILAGERVSSVAKKSCMNVLTLLKFLDASGIEIKDPWSRSYYARETWGRPTHTRSL